MWASFWMFNFPTKYLRESSCCITLIYNWSLVLEGEKLSFLKCLLKKNNKNKQTNNSLIKSPMRFPFRQKSHEKIAWGNLSVCCHESEPKLLPNWNFSESFWTKHSCWPVLVYLSHPFWCTEVDRLGMAEGACTPPPFGAKCEIFF